MDNLKERTVRGGFAKAWAQAITFPLRIGSLMILARLLEPADFGLLGMVTAFTGILNLFKDAGLSTASVQRDTVSDEQLSTLFWINILVGGGLGLVSFTAAPVLVQIYHEPRLLWVTVSLSTAFLFNAAGVQHSAILQRQMRFTALAIIEIISWMASVAVGVGMAIGGGKYWALVGMTVSLPAVSTISMWLITHWIPGSPRRGIGVRSMLNFGGIVTLNGIVVYIAYNIEKVLLGRYWGAAALGIYGRAYQLGNIATDNLNTAIGGVSFAALSRLQNDTNRYKSYFLKSYSLSLAMTVPATLACAVFADEIISVFLGPTWKNAAPILRLLSPTILVFGLINPFAWLLNSLGLVKRSLYIALALAPLVITANIIGLSRGPKGIAFAYSTIMTLWVVPHIALCIHKTMICPRDVLQAFGRPFLAGAVATLLAFIVNSWWTNGLSAVPRLIVGAAVFSLVYLGIILFLLKQKDFYFGLFRELKRR